MKMDNGTQLQNIGLQLKNMGGEIYNIGAQMKNMMLDIGIQLENLGVQTSEIGIQIFNIGMQFSNMIMVQNQNMANMFNQMMEFKMPINQNQVNMNQINALDINNNGSNNNNSGRIINCIFNNQTGSRNNICIKENETIEELIKSYMKRVGWDYKDIEIKKVYFLLYGEKIDIHDKRLIKDFQISNNNLIFKICWEDIKG